MEQIAKDEFNKRYADYPFGSLTERRNALHFFTLGWILSNHWIDLQNEMDRDYQEELNQQEALRRGYA